MMQLIGRLLGVLKCLLPYLVEANQRATNQKVQCGTSVTRDLVIINIVVIVYIHKKQMDFRSD